ILSVDEGQTDSAKALGMTRLQTMRRIVLPQAMRVIIPPTGNETISMLKTSSLVSVIATTELLYSVQLIYAVNYRTIPLLIVARLEVLRGVTLDVQASQVMCLLGPSGSGKTTFLRTINHLERIDSGRLAVDGELVGYRESGGRIYELRENEIARKRAEIGMVF